MNEQNNNLRKVDEPIKPWQPAKNKGLTRTQALTLSCLIIALAITGSFIFGVRYSCRNLIVDDYFTCHSKEELYAAQQKNAPIINISIEGQDYYKELYPNGSLSEDNFTKQEIDAMTSK